MVYARRLGGTVYSFEASGGLVNAALIMRDFETESYWSLMEESALSGPAAGTQLEELAGAASKVRWKDWVAQHPDTKILRVSGRDDLPQEPYKDYFESEKGYGGYEARDKRLPTKEPIYALRLGERKIAVPASAFAGGKVFSLGEGNGWLLLYRPLQAHLFQSSLAFVSRAGFERKRARWQDKESGAFLHVREGEWVGGQEPHPETAGGFDTFWYSWSLSNPDTELLGVE